MQEVNRQMSPCRIFVAIKFPSMRQKCPNWKLRQTSFIVFHFNKNHEKPFIKNIYTGILEIDRLRIFPEFFSGDILSAKFSWITIDN